MMTPLRACPTCGGKAPEGLRNYRWAEDALPGKVSPTDLDFVLQQDKTGRVLVIEFKQPGEKVPPGQQILLKHLASLAYWTVWVVWEGHETVSMAKVYPKGGMLKIGDLPIKRLAEKVGKWWQDGLR